MKLSNSIAYIALLAMLALSLYGCASVPPMYWAIYHQENDRVAAMLDGGEDPNVRWLRSSPLHQAVGADNLGAVVLLLRHGADPFVRDQSGRTPLLLARKRNNDPRIIKVLEDAEAQKLGQITGAVPALPATQSWPAAGSATGLKATLAVMDLTAGSGLSPEQGALLTDKLMSELGKSRNFTVVERAKRDEVLRAQGFKQSGACDQRTCLAAAGQALGVQKMAGGTLSKFGSTYTVELRIVDVTAGRVDQEFSREYSGDVLVLLGAMQDAAAAFSGPRPSAPPTVPPAATPSSPPTIRRK